MRESVKPCQSSGKEQNLGEQSGRRGACTNFGASLENISGEESDKRIRHQKSAGGADEVRDSSGSGQTGRTEYRHSGCALDQIKGHRGESAARAEQQTHQ